MSSSLSQGKSLLSDFLNVALSYSAKPAHSDLCELLLTEVLTLINCNSCYFSRVFLASQHIYRLEKKNNRLIFNLQIVSHLKIKNFLISQRKEIKIWYQFARDMYSSWSYKWRHLTSITHFQKGVPGKFPLAPSPKTFCSIM